MAVLKILLTRDGSGGWVFSKDSAQPANATVYPNGDIDLSNVKGVVDIEWRLPGGNDSIRFKRPRTKYGPIFIVGMDGGGADDFGDPDLRERRKVLRVPDDNGKRRNNAFMYILLTNEEPIHPRIRNQGDENILLFKEQEEARARASAKPKRKARSARKKAPPRKRKAPAAKKA